MIETLKKQTKAIDLCLAACRKRQSPRTGFVHLFWGGEETSDTIPIYENFCFALALYRQKTVEAALEGKDLLERLFPFQTADGCFPVYLHEYPRCRDWMQGLKIAPLLIQLLRRFSPILQPELKQKISSALEKILTFCRDKANSGPWPLRHRMCKEGGSVPKPDKCAAADWTEWLISAQLGQDPISIDKIFHSGLQLFIGAPEAQERFEPKPNPIEWLFAEQEEAFSERLLRDHPLQIHLAALWPLETPVCKAEGDQAILQTADELRIFWPGEQLHSLVLPKLKGKVAIQDQFTITVDLPEEADQSRNDLFEAALFCDFSSEIDLSIDGRKGTTFYLGDTVEISSPQGRFSIRFELVSGSGDFRGHLSRGNRPNQIAVKNHEAYDWQIGLRTLRRSPNAQICIHLKKI
ncbi:MAG: hypothetical protein JSS32_10600 [Verrucomicrobia bacterium]|nr:hypothetical protein [Verrucomicrobiota bacterium]